MDVSVVIPCYNHANTLARAVNSALQQSHVAQVVVVNDASTDDTVACATELCTHDNRLKLINHVHNLGPGAARNRGVAETTGNYIVFLDADDEFIDGFVTTALNCFQQMPTLNVAKCEALFFDPVKGYVLPKQDPRYAASILSSSCGMLMRRDAFLRIGGFPEKDIFRGAAGGEDVAFMQAVMAHLQPIAKVEAVGYKVWTSSGSHVDKFLASTRLTEVGGFEFVADVAMQKTADELQNAIGDYLVGVKELLRK